MYHTDKCKHPDCNYQHGWDYTKSTSEPTWVEGKHGDFYELTAGMFDDVKATRFHGDKNTRKVVGCPCCNRIFIGEVVNG